MKKKDQLSSFDFIVLIKELRDILIDGFINKVYQPSKDELLIRITRSTTNDPKITTKEEEIEALDNGQENKKKYRPRYQQIIFKIKLGKYFYAEKKQKNFAFDSSNRSELKHQPRSFAMLLRKHLKNGRITNLYQHEFDRILVIDIAKREQFKIIIEMFGDGNVILVKDGKIIQPLYSHTWRARTLRAGEQYQFPPPRNNPKTIEASEFIEILKKSNRDLVRTLIMDLDVPGKFAEEMCFRAKLDKNMKLTVITDKDLDNLFEIMMGIFELVESEPQTILVCSDEQMTTPIDLVPIVLHVNKEQFSKELESYNSGVKLYFDPANDSEIGLGVTVKKMMKARSEKLEFTSSEGARLQRQLEQQENALEKFKSEILANQKMGEAVYGNYQRIEDILHEIETLRASVEPDDIIEHLERTDDVIELNPHDGYLILQLTEMQTDEKLNLKLDLRKNVIENANLYYEKSKHAKEKLHGAERALISTKQSMSNLEKKLKKIENVEIPQSKRSYGRHFWFEKFHWMLSSNNNLIVAGRDAKSNDQVVKKYLKDHDRYCHADLTGAPSVVVKHNADEDMISETTLQEACEFALIYSKAWHAKYGSGTAYWVKPDQVSKTPQSGEYLARGAFVVRGKRHYVGNIKLQLAIAEIDYQGQRKLMAGPIQAVKMLAGKYIILAPGDIKKSDIANKLSDIFNVVVDEILSLLPSGEFAILQQVGY